MNTEDIRIVQTQNGEQKQLQMVLAYDPVSRGFASRIDPGIPANELIGAIEIIKAQLIAMQVQNMMMQQAKQQSTRVQVAQSVPPELLRG